MHTWASLRYMMYLLVLFPAAVYIFLVSGPTRRLELPASDCYFSGVKIRLSTCLFKAIEISVRSVHVDVFHQDKQCEIDYGAVEIYIFHRIRL